MKKSEIKYFLGANSCNGFISAFCECYDPFDGWKAYIIKGGPGTGKSSFMKYVAKTADKKGIKVILCPCSSDPDSLDGVIMPEKKTVILDGTAPHIVEPVFPGACEEILNFGQFWNSRAFQGKEKDIIDVTLKNKALHKAASGYLSAVGQLLSDNLKIAQCCTDYKKTESFAAALCKNYIPSKNAKGREWIRFISATTPKGIISYPETVTQQNKNLVVISDKYGSASSTIMQKIREYAILNGYEIITLKNAFLPEKIIDHIVIPELSLAFVTENDYIKFETDVRRIHSRRFVNSSLLHNSRERLKFNSKAAEVLLGEGCTTLKKAKAVHDVLEKYYISAMDFNSLNGFAEEFAKEIL